MRIGYSNTSHRIVGCFETGEQLPQALIDLCLRENIRAGQLSGQGMLSAVTLDVHDRARRQYLSAFQSEGSFELLHLGGNISMLGPQHIVNLHAVIALHEHGQNRVVGGQLREATVHWVEFAIQVFDDLLLNRTLDLDTNLPVWKDLGEPHTMPPAMSTTTRPARELEAERAAHGGAETEQPSTATVSRSAEPVELASTGSREAYKRKGAAPKLATKTEWQDAARQSSKLLERKKAHAEPVDWESYTEMELQVGDILVHPRLGECTVVKVEDDSGVWIRIPESNRISKLALSAVKLEHVGERKGVRVFRITGAP